MISVGSLVAAGRTSDVYAYGRDSVVKVPRPEVPAHWAALEARFTAAIRELGAPAPEVREVVRVDDRDAIVFERIDGESLWQRMLDAPRDIVALTRELADVHRRILSSGLPADLLGHVDRVCVKIADAAELAPSDRVEAQGIARRLPNGAALLHGDLHPGNVLMRGGEPVVIDWFDASIGHAVADVVRSSLLIRPGAVRAARPHLPGATVAMLRRVHTEYVAAMADVLVQPDDELRRWEAVVAASRLSEGAQPDSDLLVRLWRDRAGGSASQLLAALSAARRDGHAVSQ